MVLRRIWFLILFAGCGIKAPPRPPLPALIDEAQPALVDTPDAGCCGEAKNK